MVEVDSINNLPQTDQFGWIVGIYIYSLLPPYYIHKIK